MATGIGGRPARLRRRIRPARRGLTRDDRGPARYRVSMRACYARPMERIVHVCNGDSTADTLSLADLPGEIRVWADALDVGPVLPVSDEAHYKARGEFWASKGEGTAAD